MSAVNISEAQKGLAHDQATVKLILIENSQLITTISEYQRLGRIEEATKFQELLHKNLVYLAKLADSSTINTQLQQELNEIKSKPPLIVRPTAMVNGGCFKAPNEAMNTPNNVPSYPAYPQQIILHQAQTNQLQQQQIQPNQPHVAVAGPASYLPPPQAVSHQLQASPNNGGRSTPRYPAPTPAPLGTVQQQQQMLHHQYYSHQQLQQQAYGTVPPHHLIHHPHPNVGMMPSPVGAHQSSTGHSIGAMPPPAMPHPGLYGGSGTIYQHHPTAGYYTSQHPVSTTAMHTVQHQQPQMMQAGMLHPHMTHHQMPQHQHQAVQQQNLVAPGMMIPSGASPSYMAQAHTAAAGQWASSATAPPPSAGYHHHSPSTGQSQQSRQ